ncbi:MAG: hypothetical protein FVQ83_16800 [Chloroflexi bacterium]|nr:hypothetical protein [Chloroflexota bacterium]
MRVEYRRTFSQFIDTYLGTYFGTAGQTVWRILGGPFWIIVGVLLFILAGSPGTWLFFKFIIYSLSVLIALYGAAYIARPAVNLLLVWLRREEFLGAEGALIALELHEDCLRVFEGDNSFDVPLEEIATIQQRADSAWIITQTENLIYVPGKDAISGDPDAFLAALDEAIAEEDEE